MKKVKREKIKKREIKFILCNVPCELEILLTDDLNWRLQLVFRTTNRFGKGQYFLKFERNLKLGLFFFTLSLIHLLYWLISQWLIVYLIKSNLILNTVKISVNFSQLVVLLAIVGLESLSNRTISLHLKVVFSHRVN